MNAARLAKTAKSPEELPGYRIYIPYRSYKNPPFTWAGFFIICFESPRLNSSFMGTVL